jgi:hypothetical protein
MKTGTLVALAGLAMIIASCSATPLSAGSSDAVVRGTLAVCGPEAPTLTLHQMDGKVVSSSVWPPHTRRVGQRTLDFSFTVQPGEYYLAMNNQDQMPARDRQMDLVGNQAFVTHIVACIR